MISLRLQIAILAIFVVVTAIIMQSCDLEYKDGDYYYRQALESLANDSVDEAFCQIDKALSLYMDEGKHEKESEARIILGMLYFSNNQKEKAYDIIKCLDISPEDTCNYLLKSNYFRIKGYYQSLIEKNDDEAIRCIDVVIKNDAYVDPKNRRQHQIIDMLNKTEFLLNADDNDASASLLQEIETMVGRDSIYFPQLFVNKARLMEHLGVADSAYIYSDVVVKTTRKIYQDGDNMLTALRIMMYNDSITGDFAAYVKHRDHYEAVIRQQSGDQAKLRMELLSTKNKMELSELNYQHKYQMYVMWSIIIVCGLLIVTLLIISKYQAAKRQRLLIQMECDKLDAECFKRKLECELYARKMEATNEEMRKINQDLLDLSYKLTLVDKPDVSDGKGSSKSYLERLQSKVATEHPGFSKRMTDSYPSITKTELLLAELIRLNLNTEEITASMNISQAGLIKARYRLRKRLGVQSSSELDSFIASV